MNKLKYKIFLDKIIIILDIGQKYLSKLTRSNKERI